MADGKQLVCLDDFMARAKDTLPTPVWEYYSSGADEENTLRENRKAYRRYWLKPRVLRDVSVIDMATNVLGEKIAMPICISPTALHGLAHPEAEIATCKAAAEMGTAMIMSAFSSKSLEEIAALRPKSIKWQNVYTWSDREVTKDMIARAERAGFKAIVISVDVPVFGIKRRITKLGGLAMIITLQSFGNLDKYIGKIDVLSDIVDAVGDKLEVYVDGGIRTGTDVLKALALGARAVFIGRPVVYGLTCNGEGGVKAVLQILRDELSRAMALTGCSRISDISRDLLSKADQWSKL
ncbi:2-Hydroxyacid oxidase 1-like [Ptychodera flava]|uniref:2-Hydroxyacid oxidase 1-like n=1 Tax=Ptychodera flava TaxID=63121 RepID=UPI00396A9F62